MFVFAYICTCRLVRPDLIIICWHHSKSYSFSWNVIKMTKWSRVFFWVFGSPWHFINKARLMCLQMDNKDFCMDWTRVCCYSVAKLCLTLQFHGLQHARFPLSFTISQSLIKFTSIGLVMSWNHLIFCCNLFLLPSIIPSIRVFSNESTLHIRWP